MSHIFISYVRENADKVDRLVTSLRSAGAPVWLDRNELMPGQRWQDSIRQAIQAGAFFVACFSKEYLGKNRSYMNEELLLAIEELRKRPSDRAWFIPVLLSECSLPDRSIGPGESLQSIQYADLFSDWDEGVKRLIRAVLPSLKSVIQSPWLGIRFIQRECECAMSIQDNGNIRVNLRSEPFEILIPSAPKGGVVRICTSRNSSTFDSVAPGKSFDEVPFFRIGTGMADTAYGSGPLWIKADSHMYFDWGGRLLPGKESGGRIMVNAVHEVKNESAAFPQNTDVYCLFCAHESGDNCISHSNCERFILSFLE
jgi:hypothetical protein